MINYIHIYSVVIITVFYLINDVYAETTVDDVSLLNKTGSEIYQQFYRQASEYMVLYAGKDLRVAINQPAQWQNIPVCSSPLDIRFSEVNNAGKLTASVACHGKGNQEDLNWKQRLSVNIDFMVSVVITPSYIKKGQVLNLPFTTPIDIFLNPVVKGLIRYSGTPTCCPLNTKVRT